MTSATGKPVPVCGNTASMLAETRLSEHFVIEGDRSVHYGLFECEPGTGDGGGQATGVNGCC